MTPKSLVAAALGEISWRPPAWLQRVGLRRAGYGVGALVVAGMLAVGGYVYIQGLPKPLRVGADVEMPGVSRIDRDDELVIEPLQLDFRYAVDPDIDAEPPPRLSAARLDLVGEVVDEGIELDPPLPGEWRFVSENRLAFTPTEDWPADREYRVLLSRDVFAPDVKLADPVVEFETPPFVASVLESMFYQHPEIVTERRVTASFGFSHPVARDDFEQRLTLSMREGTEEAPTAEPRELGFRVEYGPHDRTAHVHSDIVVIPERENFATVTVDEDLLPANGDGLFEEALFAQVRVPDRESYFRVDGISASIVKDPKGDPMQTAVVSFTDQVNTDEFGDAIQAWLLPKDPPSGARSYQVTEAGHYVWRSPSEVTVAVLADSEPMTLTVNPTERDTALLQSVVFDAPEERFVYLRIEPGLTSAGDFVLAAAYDEVVRAPDYPTEAAIAQDGALLPLTGNRLLTFSARGVSAVKVDIQQLLPGALNHLASQSGGDIRDPWFRYRFDADNLSALTTRIVELNPGHPREQIFATLDLDPFLDAGGVFYVKVQGWDPETERGVGSSDRRLALVTDLGLLAKTNADKSQHVFVHSIATGEPVEGALVELLGKNGLAVLTGHHRCAGTCPHRLGGRLRAGSRTHGLRRAPRGRCDVHALRARRPPPVLVGVRYRRRTHGGGRCGAPEGGRLHGSRALSTGRNGASVRHRERRRLRRRAGSADRAVGHGRAWPHRSRDPGRPAGRRLARLGFRDASGVADRPLHREDSPRAGRWAAARAGGHIVQRRGIPAGSPAYPCVGRRAGRSGAGRTAVEARDASSGVAEAGCPTWPG